MKPTTNLNLKHRILLLFLPINIASIILILTLSVALLVHNSKEKTIQNTADKLSLVADQTDRIISNVKYNVKAFSTKSALQEAIQMDYSQDTYGSYMFSTSMHSCVYNIMDISSLITNGYIHTYNNKIYNIKTDTVSYTTDKLMDDRYNEITSHFGQIMLKTPMDTSGSSALNISKSLIDVQTGNCLGILTFDVKEKLFSEAYSKISDENSEHFFIVDSNGIIISDQDSSLLRETVDPAILNFIQNNSNPYKVLYLNNERILLMAIPIEQTNWHVVCTISYSQIFKEAYFFTILLLLIGCLVLLATVFLSGILAKSLVQPITQLVDYADEVGQGNLDALMTVDSPDEIGFLAKRFHETIGNIKELTLCIYSEQNQKREYALNLLQAQINPHFLYNCLDNISTLIESKENKTASSMILHLGRYYKSVLSKGRNIVTIREEIHLIQDYLQIQLIKDCSLFTYEINIDPALKDHKILKLLLQPIVENSIIHGFLGYRTNGFIQISGSANEGTVIIEILDNGRGISPEVLEQIFVPTDMMIPRHFGLRNIHERIQLKFGASYGLTVDSTLNKGTLITLRFPKVF